MYRVQKSLQRIKNKLQETFASHIWKQWRNRLRPQQWIFVLVPLGGILLKLIPGQPNMVTLQGEIMCTPYYIQYLDRWGKHYQEEIDALLMHLHESLCIDLPDSELSRFNEHDCSDFHFESPCFYPVVAKSKEIYRSTAGAFDPTVMPLVNAWKDTPDDTIHQDSVLAGAPCECIGLDYIVANAQRVKKLKEGVKLNFGGILKGYAVDKIATLLRTHGIEHMHIALGSETVAYGRPSKITPWYMAIHTHVAALVGADAQIIMELKDQAVAIAKEKLPDQKCIIDPATGCPAQHTLLAAAVVGKDCSTANAYATAMMARGLAFSQELLSKEEDLAAFLIYEDDRGTPAFYTSSGLHMLQKDNTITLSYHQKAY